MAQMGLTSLAKMCGKCQRRCIRGTLAKRAQGKGRRGLGVAVQLTGAAAAAVAAAAAMVPVAAAPAAAAAGRRVGGRHSLGGGGQG